MRDPTEIFSHVLAISVLGALVAAWSWMPALSDPQPHVVSSGPEISLTEAEPETPKVEPPPAAATAAEPPPPPPPEPDVEPPKEPPPPEPVEPLKDEDGARAPVVPKVSDEASSAFKTCLQKKATYPTSREARKLRPRGLVVVGVLMRDGVVTSVEIIKSSGSQILDEVAMATVQKSGCGAQGESGSVTGAIMY